MKTNAVRPSEARRILGIGSTKHFEETRDGYGPQPGLMSDAGTAVIYFTDELELYLEFRRDKRDKRISADQSWIEYEERVKAKAETRLVDRDKIKAHQDFIELKKAGKIAVNIWWRDWYAERLAKTRGT